MFNISPIYLQSSHAFVKLFYLVTFLDILQKYARRFPQTNSSSSGVTAHGHYSKEQFSSRQCRQEVPEKPIHFTLILSSFLVLPLQTRVPQLEHYRHFGEIRLCWGDFPEHCRMFSSIPLDDKRNPTLPVVVTIKNVTRHCQISSLWTKSLLVENHCSRSTTSSGAQVTFIVLLD